MFFLKFSFFSKNRPQALLLLGVESAREAMAKEIKTKPFCGQLITLVGIFVSVLEIATIFVVQHFVLALRTFHRSFIPRPSNVFCQSDPDPGTSITGQEKQIAFLPFSHRRNHKHKKKEHLFILKILLAFITFSYARAFACLASKSSENHT